MAPYSADAADRESATVAAMHSRNRAFGDESCYTCHRDYGLFGTVTTKLGGFRHAWAYYVTGWERPLELHRPYANEACTRCHSMTLAGFRDEPEHGAVGEELARGSVSCVASGCHGPAHLRDPRIWHEHA